MAVVLERAGKHLAGFRVDAPDPVGIEDGTAGTRAFILDLEEAAGVPPGLVLALPRLSVRLGIIASLVGSTEGRSLGSPVSKKDVQFGRLAHRFSGVAHV